MREVYVVTAGSYSDYHILGVFDYETLADKIVAFDPGNRDIRIFDLNDASSLYRNGFAPFSVTLQDDKRPYIRLSEGDPGDSLWTEWPDTPPRFISGGRINVWARDKEHALKIASDKRAEYLAAQEGIS